MLRTGLVGISAVERRGRLEAAGLMRSRNRVDQAAMLRRAADFFAPVGVYLPAASSTEALARWMPGMVRSARRGAHPLLHVLMDVFLTAQPPVAPKVVSPFGTGPWPCLNPLASHTGERVVAGLSCYRTKGRMVARFECNCGYVYSRSLSADGTKSKPRYYRYGPLLEPELRRLVSGGASLRATARAIGLDPNTVAAEARRLGLTVTWRTAEKRVHPATRSTIPSSPPPALAIGRRRVRAPRLDWPARDAETLVRCRHAAAALIKLESPTRLTFAAIERAAAGRTGWIRARSCHLPRTISFIARVVESTDVFKRRRASFEIGRTGGAVEPWRVMRAAGLTGADLPMIRELIEATLPDAVRLAA